MKFSIALLACLHLCSGFQPRISGGHNAVLQSSGGHDAAIKQREAASTVFITTFNKYCTGSIISPNWVLTAAHCIDPEIPPEGHIIDAGIVDYYAFPWPQKAQEVRGKFVVTHPSYRLFNATNNTDIGSYDDMGLIQTDQPFTFDAYVRRVPISGRSFYGPANCKALGFGDTEKGKEHKMKYIKINKIARCTVVPVAELRELYKNDVVTTDNYQCSYGEGSSHVLGGDSGGPLLCGGVQFGVCFWGMKMDHKEKYIVMHTATHGYVDWIKSYVKDVHVI